MGLWPAEAAGMGPAGAWHPFETETVIESRGGRAEVSPLVYSACGRPAATRCHLEMDAGYDRVERFGGKRSRRPFQSCVNLVLQSIFRSTNGTLALWPTSEAPERLPSARRRALFMVIRRYRGTTIAGARSSEEIRVKRGRGMGQPGRVRGGGSIGRIGLERRARANDKSP
jgi:hypothetical protein